MPWTQPCPHFPMHQKHRHSTITWYDVMLLFTSGLYIYSKRPVWPNSSLKRLPAPIVANASFANWSNSKHLWLGTQACMWWQLLKQTLNTYLYIVLSRHLSKLDVLMLLKELNSPFFKLGSNSSLSQHEFLWTIVIFYSPASCTIWWVPCLCIRSA